MIDPLTASVVELAEALRQGALSAREVVEVHLARIDRVNPLINAVVQLAPDALEWAGQADADRERNLLHGPLHGVPFTVKDALATAGLDSPIDRRLRRRSSQTDATVVARMQEAGAILLGKTNCPPTGAGMDTENTVTGRTLNPHDLALSPGGSSGGEAALIAAGGTPCGLGVDTSGGIRVPAHYCGVPALKPTTGRVPSTGGYNLPGGLVDIRSQIGPLARSVADLALLFGLIAGPDYIDSGVIPMPLFSLDAVDLGALRLAFCPGSAESPVCARTEEAVLLAAQTLTGAGVVCEEAWPQSAITAARAIDAGWRATAGTRGQDLVELHAAWNQYRSHLLQFMTGYDALLCPVAETAAPPYGVLQPGRFDYTVPFNLTGFPSVVVPLPPVTGSTPLAVQIVAHPWREDVALALAHHIEIELGRAPRAEPEIHA